MVGAVVVVDRATCAYARPPSCIALLSRRRRVRGLLLLEPLERRARDEPAPVPHAFDLPAERESVQCAVRETELHARFRERQPICCRG